MEQPTEQPLVPTGKYEPCGKCKRGWDSARQQACECYAEFLGRTVPALLAKHAAGPR